MSIEEKVLVEGMTDAMPSMPPPVDRVENRDDHAGGIPRRSEPRLRVLSVTNMYPTPTWPAFGTFVLNEVKSLRAAGVSVDVLVMNGRDSKWSYLRGLFRLWHALARRKYDVIHAHYVLTGAVARLQWGTPVVLTHHGCEVLGYPRWQTWLAKAINPLFDEVIYRSEEMRQA